MSATPAENNLAAQRDESSIFTALTSTVLTELLASETLWPSPVVTMSTAAIMITAAPNTESMYHIVFLLLISLLNISVATFLQYHYHL